MENKEMNEIIRAELAKIEKGSRNEGNLLKYIYLTMRAEEIIENLPRIGSSRAKDEETYRWRYASNEAKWAETLVLQGKSIDLQRLVSLIEDLERVAPAKFAEKQAELEELRIQRDFTRANYYMKIADYERIMKERKEIEAMDFDLSDLKISVAEIAKLIKGMKEENKIAFWKKYFEAAAEYIVSAEAAEKELKGSIFGE